MQLALLLPLLLRLLLLLLLLKQGMGPGGCRFLEMHVATDRASATM